MAISITKTKIGNSYEVKNFGDRFFVLINHVNELFHSIDREDYDYLMEHKSMEATKMVEFIVVRNRICNVKGKPYGQARMDTGI